MTSTAPSTKWGLILLASVSVWVFGFVLIAAIIFAYAFSLGLAARGAPDPAAIQQFANAVGPIWGPRLSIVFTGIAAIWLGRQVPARPVLHGFLIGLIVGGVPFAVRHPLALEPILTLSAILLVGGTGGWLGRHLKGSTSTSGPTRHAV